MLNKFLASILIFMMTLGSTASKAEQFKLPVPSLLEGEEELGSVISPMKKGQKASFTGVLLSPLAVAELVARLNSFEEELGIEINRVRAELVALNDLNLERKKAEYEAELEIVNSNLEFVSQQKDQALKELEKEIKNRPSRTFWFSLGALTGVGLTLTILFAAKELR